MLVFVLIGCLGLYIYLRKKSTRRPPLPPGPPADPIIGHLRLISPDQQDTQFYEWGKIYGDVMHLHVLGRPIIVLNSVKAAVDLLEKRSANYSDRPPLVLFNMMGWESGMAFIPYGKRFQRHRKMFQSLAPHRCLEFQPVQSREAGVLLQNLLKDAESREKFIQRFSTAIIMRIAYGHQITSDDDPYIKIAEDTGYALANGGPVGSTPVDFFPFLLNFPSWFPGAYYAGFARDNKFAIYNLHNYPYEEVTAQMAEGKARPSFLASQLETHSRQGADAENTIEDIKGAAGAMYGAGADTTAATLSVFFLAMVLNPDVQARAQEEIDRVVGPDRLPEFEDRVSLPYLNCVLQETLRWNPVVPLGLPHRSIEDDVYEGMFIPKGSLVIPNTRAMTLDEDVYKDATSFNPARFLPKPQGNEEPIPGGPFGFGRRICPGRHLAEASIWISMAYILATMKITKAVDTKGREVTPEVAFNSGLTSHPYPYRCAIQPRSEAARILVDRCDTSDTY